VRVYREELVAAQPEDELSELPRMPSGGTLCEPFEAIELVEV
jgi:hypothetical protein